MNRKNGIIKSFKIFYNRSSSHFMFVNLRKYCVMNCVVHHYCTHVCHPFKILTLCLIYVRNIMYIRPISRETWRGFITLFATSRTHIKIWQSLIRLDVKWRRYGECYILAKAFQALFLVLAI